MTSTEPTSAQYEAFHQSILKMSGILDDIAESIQDQQYKEMYEELMKIFKTGVVKTQVLLYIQRRAKPRIVREPKTLEEKLAKLDKKGRNIYELCKMCDRCINLKGAKGYGMEQHHDSMLCKSIRASKKYSLHTKKMAGSKQKEHALLDDHFIHKFKYGINNTTKLTLASHGVDISSLPQYFV